MLLQIVITVLCGVGLYASLFMLSKTRRDERGLLEEPSVVQLPRARLYGGLPNALLGSLYYPAVAIAVWFFHGRTISLIVLSIAAFAAITSAILAYSLLFITKRPCPYCWTAHAVNWLLPVMILFAQNG
jgi:uncharacterized membrane protein